jgi:hypothetical protein
MILLMSFLFYIDNVRVDERLVGIKTISKLAKLMVSTYEHLAFLSVYRVLKLLLL